MGFRRIAIIFGVFIVISIISSNLRGNDEEETEIENIQEEEVEVIPPEVFAIREPIMVSGLTYDVTDVSVSDSWPTIGLSEETQGEYMLVAMYVKNLSKEPRSELTESDFTLEDSEDRKFRVIQSTSLTFGESWSTLQPGLGGYRGVVFQIPFNSELEYKLLIEDNKSVQLGMGKDLNIVKN